MPQQHQLISLHILYVSRYFSRNMIFVDEPSTPTDKWTNPINNSYESHIRPRESFSGTCLLPHSTTCLILPSPLAMPISLRISISLTCSFGKMYHLLPVAVPFSGYVITIWKHHRLIVMKITTTKAPRILLLITGEAIHRLLCSSQKLRLRKKMWIQRRRRY